MRSTWCWLLIACAGSAKRDGDAPTTQACPASFAGASGTCRAFVSCAYPEGTCECSRCPGGAAMKALEPGEPPPPRYWTCAPTPPAIEGCPGAVPRASAPCESEGARCTYPQTCGYVTTAECRGGAWIVTLPSPPS